MHFESQDLRQLKHCFIISLANLQNSRVSDSFLVDLRGLQFGRGEEEWACLAGRRETASTDPFMISFLLL